MRSISCSNDLGFDLFGYVMVFSSDFFLAMNGVVTKQKLDSKELGKYGLVFYNALFMLPFTVLVAWANDEFHKVSFLRHSRFLRERTA